MNFKKSQYFVPLSALALSAGLALSGSDAWGQREAPTRQENRAERRQQMENMTPEQRQEFREKRREERIANMTPEQRAQWENFRVQAQTFARQQQVAQVSVEDRQRYLMRSAGIEDITVQDAILAYAADLSKQRAVVTKAATALRILIADKAATPEELNAQLEKVTTASTEFRVWKEDALKELDAKIAFSEDARLKSFLVLAGVIGDQSNDAGGYTAIFPKDVAGEGDIVDLLPKVEGGWGGMGRMGGRGNRGGGGGGDQDPAPSNPQPEEIPMAMPAN